MPSAILYDTVKLFVSFPTHRSQWFPHPSILSSCFFFDMPSYYALTIHRARHRSLRPANPIPQQHIPDTHLRQKPFQLLETSHPSYRANCRQGTDECRYHRAFSAAILEGRGDRNSRQLKLGRTNSGARTKAGSAWSVSLLARDTSRGITDYIKIWLTC